MKIKAIIFDLDGTLLDSFSVHYSAYDKVFAKFNIKLEKEKFIETYSPNWYETYKAFKLPEKKWEEADQLWIKEVETQNPFLFAGAKQTLLHLKEKYSLGLVTSGSKTRVLKDLDNNNIKTFFNSIVTGDDIKNPKPNPEGLKKALNELRVNPHEVIYIGDSIDDFKMANAINIRFIGVKSEFANLNENDLGYQMCYIKEVPSILGCKS